MSLIDRLQQQMEHTGSTRAVGLMRVLLAATLWSRWASELAPRRQENPWYWLLALAFYVGTTGMFFGIWARASTVLTAGVLVVMVGLLGWFGGEHDWIHHHTTLLLHATVLLALTPCGRSFSVDRWLAVRRAQRDGTPIPAETGPLWAVPLLALQCSTVYLLSVWDKLSWRYLTGDHLRGIVAVHYTGSDLVDVPGYGLALAVAAISVVLLETLLGIGLFVGRWQRWLIPFGIVFHGVLYVAFPVGTFSVTMWLLFLAYVDPEVVHRRIDELFLKEEG